MTRLQPRNVVAPTLFTSTVSFARHRQIELDHLADLTGLDHETLQLGATPYPELALKRVWLELVSREPHLPLGILMGKIVPVSVFGAISDVAACAPDVRSALKLFEANAELLATRLEIRLEEGRKYATLVRRHPSGAADGGRVSTMLSVALLRMLAAYVGEYPPLKRVALIGERCGSLDHYEAAFGRNIVWDLGRPQTAFEFCREYLDRPLRHSDARAFWSGSLYLATLRAERQRQVSAQRAVRLIRAVDGAFGAGAFDVQTVVDHAGYGLRTAQRIARAEGTTLRALMDRARAEHALAVLARDPRAKLLWVAEQCGYSDDRSFRRAFRRWTGRSPTEVRRALLAQAEMTRSVR